MRLITLILSLPALISAACIDGKWDNAYTWIQDCTGPYDGLYSTPTGATVARIRQALHAPGTKGDGA